MNRGLCALAFVLGAAVVVWVGAGFVGSNPLALAMTLIIAAVYVLGAMEILDFWRATASLAHALAAIPEPLARLADWLDGVHPSLQNPVRLRIEGERNGLPGPALTPYLVGLLVMLGMLGTFLGMVVTLDGAVAALRGTTDLQAMRAELAAPIRGLGLAFGTSVAGVAASAMLGLISALSRRERALVVQRLDARIASSALRAFSLGQQRQEALQALQLQAQAMPAVVDRLHALIGQMEQRERQCNERLVSGQERFHGDLQAAFGGLAQAVAESLAGSLRDSARVAGEIIRPAVDGAMAAIAGETRLAHERVIAATQTQLDGLAAQLGETARRVAETWSEVLTTQGRTGDQLLAGIERSLAAFDARFEQRSQALLAAVGETLATFLANQAAVERQRFAEWSGSLAELATQLQRLGAGLEEPLARLIDTASDARHAAAELLAQWRQEMSVSLERDNRLLDERARTMQTLAALLAAIEQASSEQRATVDSLVTSSATLLDTAGSRFAAGVDTGSARLAEVATQLAGSAVEVASLGEAFTLAVDSFATGNEKLVTSLQRIETALEQSTARSDEQLAYYVAQARELIDLSIMAQERVVAELRQLGEQHPASGEKPD